ncbi:acyltransferase [Streptomyces sp. NPDC056188]|uniref:acyltransferase family protein n=1 Tax=Streptomyces sp. NPDC056188 TaxID=3345740 RepID=UPI0035E1808D
MSNPPFEYQATPPRPTPPPTPWPTSSVPTPTTEEASHLTARTLPHATDDPARPAPAEQPPGGPARDRYFDFLRAVALFRVVLYHLMGWAWLPVVFPSMGVMFALAGNLMARSLKRPPVQVIRGRMRRLLPPLWLLGAIGVGGMVLQGWGPNSDGHPGWWWFHLTYWIVPLSDPPYADGLHGLLGDDWASEIGIPLWYIRAYLWFVLLSPLFLKALRALPWVTIASPIALAAAFEFGHLHLPGERLTTALTDFSTFGACWILGMAYQQGVLQRLPRYIVPSVVPAIACLGLWYALSHGFREGHDMDDIAFAQCLWSFAAVLLLLHISPSWSQWPRRLRPFDRLITLLNSRAVTIYLWHNVCILAASAMWDRLWDIGVLEEHFAWLLRSSWPLLGLSWLLIGGCVVWFGWMEDVAAKRKPQLWPDGSSRKPAKGRAASHRG